MAVDYGKLGIDHRKFGDYDDCMGGFVINPTKHPRAQLYDANVKLNEHIKTQLKDGNIRQITLHCFSLRQDAYNDYANARNNKNGSAYEHMSHYVFQLRAFSSKIHLCKALMQDFFINKNPGHVWEHLDDNNWAHLNRDFFNACDKSISHCQWVGDNTKIIPFFAHAWHSHHTRLPNCTLEIEVLDDKDNILRAISRFYRHNPKLLPPLTTVRFIQYWRNESDKGIEQIYRFKPFDALTISNNSTDNMDMKVDIRQQSLELFKALKVDDNDKITVPVLPNDMTIQFSVKQSTDARHTLQYAQNDLPSTTATTPKKVVDL